MSRNAQRCGGENTLRGLHNSRVVLSLGAQVDLSSDIFFSKSFLTVAHRLYLKLLQAARRPNTSDGKVWVFRDLYPCSLPDPGIVAYQESHPNSALATADHE
jgi:hypothetical protein